MRTNKKHAEDAGSKEVMQLEIQYMKNKLEKSQEEIASASATASSREARLASDAQSELSELKAKFTTLESEKLQMQTKMASQTESMESTRNGQREMHAELSRAQQMIKMLRSKERYLESRVESLANQISKTVRDYESWEKSRLSSTLAIASNPSVRCLVRLVVARIVSISVEKERRIGGDGAEGGEVLC
jgi:chromosome segregation ATPase